MLALTHYLLSLYDFYPDLTTSYRPPLLQSTLSQLSQPLQMLQLQSTIM